MIKINNYILYHISIVLLNRYGANKKVVLLIRYTATRVNKRANENNKVI